MFLQMKPSYVSPLNKIRDSAFGTVCIDPVPTGMVIMAVYTAWQKVEIMIQ